MRFLILGFLVFAAAAVPVTAADRTSALPAPDGRRMMSAAVAPTPIVMDGVLDDEVWSLAAPATDFVQAEPHEGEPATERTEARIAFDEEAIYIGVFCHDADPSGEIVNDLRKDFTPGEQDTFEVILDTFADRRNGFVFVINPAGAKSDTQIANEGRDVNTSWDAVWNVATHRGPDGWSAEIRIPFKTLRFERGAEHIWGVNFSRRIRRKNEIDYWAPVSRVYNLYRASLAGTLAGLPDAAQGHNIRIKPYVSANTTRPLGGTEFNTTGDVGLDVKYGVTPSLTLDLTARPDFAQAEADEQQVNLTQFSLFFPEKREFFLENSGTFYFGDIPRESKTNNVRFTAPEEEILVFFSRRIGLTNSGQAIPITAGGRLTGRVGSYGLGVMSIVTQGDDFRPGDAYTVLRGRRDILGNSDVGAIFLSRNSTGSSGDYNRVFGADANFRFHRALSLNSFIARSQTPGVSGGDMSGKGSISWTQNMVHAQASFLTVGRNFRDDIGYIKRTDFKKYFLDFGVRPRPDALRKYHIRELHPHGRVNAYTDMSNVMVTRNDHAGFTTFFDNGALFEVAVNPRLERINVPFRVRPDQAFAPGRYRWNEYELLVETNHSARVSASIDLVSGGYWSGTQQTARLGALVRPSYHLTFDMALQRSAISLPAPMHDFVASLLTSRISYAFSTRAFLDTLLQYNADTRQFSANVRFDLIHRPLSDLFIVYNAQQLTDREMTPGRGLIVKYTRMLSF